MQVVNSLVSEYNEKQAAKRHKVYPADIYQSGHAVGASIASRLLH